MADSSNGRQTSIVVVVAIVGLVSTIGAAALGGYWANQSVERQFESQRGAQVEDQRREVYANFLRSTFEACEAQGEARRTGSVDDFTEASSKTNEVLVQGGLVNLIAGSTEVQDATSNLMDGVAGPDEVCLEAESDSYIDLYNAFVRSGRDDLT
jgi:type II secretory pathway pseudopilin PulG